MENADGTVIMENDDDDGTVTMEDDVVKGKDGTVLDGITYSDLKEYKKTRYSTLSISEMVHIIDCYGSFDQSSFELEAGYLDAEKRQQEKYGIPASLAYSLFMLISVRVEPKISSLSVCGEITTVSGDHANECYVYKREWQDAENFSGSDDGGYLTLNGPSRSCRPEQVHFLLESRKLSIKLYQGPGQHPLIDDHIILDYSEGGFEHVRDRVVENNEVSLTLKYVSIPIALYGRLAIKVFPRKISSNSSNSVCVRGKVVAQYKNTLGNYASEEIVLFDKNPGQYEIISLNSASVSLPLQRDWVVAPAYSSLHLRVDLFNSEEKPILAEDVELETFYPYRPKDFISDEYLISVSCRWFNTFQPPGLDGLGHQISGLEEWELEPAVEVFSVLVWCGGECKPLQIHGHLQFNTSFVSKDLVEKGFDIFKSEEVPLTLLRRGDAIPLLNVGSRSLCYNLPVSLICDLKETTLNSKIKGYQIIREDACLDKHLCAVFRGDNGFAAVHFSIFRSAVEALLVKVFVYRKGSQCAVSGSICAQSEGFGYSSQYEKDWYSTFFFKGREELEQMNAVGSISLGGEDLVQMDADGLTPLSKFSIPLSRTSFVVPSYSSSRFLLDLEIGTEIVRTNLNVETYKPTMSFEGKECKLVFVFDWGDEEK